MQRTIPVWLFLFFLLLWALGTVGFGWAIRSKLAGAGQSGYFGEFALAIASFPNLATDVILQLVDDATGDYKDAELLVRREANADYSDFEPVPLAAGIDVQRPLLKVGPGSLAPGWRMLAGAFVVDGSMENAVLLLSPELKIVKRWVLDEVPVDGWKPRPKHLKFVHGVELLPDGSLIFTFDGSVSLQRIASCGNRLWATGGEFNHSVMLNEAGDAVWTFSGLRDIAEVSVADGSVLRRITVDDIIAANPTTDILGGRLLHDNDINVNSRNTDGKWFYDPFHFNDVEPLPSAIADRFPGFDAGDLLISARSLNLLFVMDPQTLHIKWWRAGMTQRQHDPDWLPSGEILVFNNRMSRDYSELVAINPTTLARREVFDGRTNDFYSRIRGKHQQYPDGHRVISSPQQGRAFELDPHGDLALVLVNPKPGSDSDNYVISEMQWFPLDALDVANWQCPPAS